MVQSSYNQARDQSSAATSGVTLRGGGGVTAEGDIVTSTALSGSVLKVAAHGLHSGLNENALRVP